MKVAIVGSRQYPPQRQPRISELVRMLPPGTSVASGGATGADEAAERAARAFGYLFVPFYVDQAGLPEDTEERRREYGRRAYARTTEMVTWADEVWAFYVWCMHPRCARPRPHRTHGTAHAIHEGRRLARRMRLFGPHGREDGAL